MSGYLIYRRDEIVKGEKYFAVDCQHCSEPIYFLDAKHAVNARKAFAGTGQIITQCKECLGVNVITPKQIERRKAQKEYPSTYPPRIAKDKSPRQPLYRKFKNASVVFGIGYIEDRPRCAALVGQIITSWADVERQAALLLAEILGTHVPAAAAVFATMRNSRVQSDALGAAAEATLSKADLRLFRAYMKRKAVLEKERNDLAHGCFGVSPNLPEGIIWISQADFLNYDALRTHDKAVQKKFEEARYYYGEGTLQRIAEEVREFHAQLGFYRGYLSARKDGEAGENFRKGRYDELATQVHIKQFM